MIGKTKAYETVQNSVCTYIRNKVLSLSSCCWMIDKISQLLLSVSRRLVENIWYEMLNSVNYFRSTPDAQLSWHMVSITSKCHEAWHSKQKWYVSTLTWIYMHKHPSKKCVLAAIQVAVQTSRCHVPVTSTRRWLLYRSVWTDRSVGRIKRHWHAQRIQ